MTNSETSLPRVISGSGDQSVLIIDDDVQSHDVVREMLAELGRKNYPGKTILLSGGDIGVLAIARRIATLRGLNLLGAFIKPIAFDTLLRAMASLSQFEPNDRSLTYSRVEQS